MDLNLCYNKLNASFVKKGIELKKFDFFTMVSHSLNVSFLNAKMVSLISNGTFKKLKNYCKKLITGMPIQYVLQSANFYGRDFFVNENVLIPRFDSENIIKPIVDVVLENDKVLDLCCGSGVLGITVAKECGKEIKLTLADISPHALDVAKKNAYSMYVDAITIQSDLFEKLDEVYDIIICNPPYITEDDYTGLDDMVKNFEPKLALVSGESGYEFYEKIIPQLKDKLGYRGKIFFEIGIHQEEVIKKLLNPDFRCIKIIKDNSGINRFISAVKRDNI